MIKWMKSLFAEKPLEDGDFGYAYGFHDHDFIRMHFPGAEDSMEEGQLAWIHFDNQGSDWPSDRLYLRPVSKKLIRRWKKETPGAFPIYDAGRLEYCTLATEKDNLQIKGYLFYTYRPPSAQVYYNAWLKRLGEKKVNVSA